MKNTNQFQEGKMSMQDRSHSQKVQWHGILKQTCVLLVLAICFVSCRKESLQNVDIPEGQSAIPGGGMQLLSLETSQSFKVMSFNTRHDDSGDPHSLTYRQNLIKQIIVDNSPDVFGLQEYSDQPFKDWFQDEMTTLGYGSYRPGSSGSPKIIFYKNSRFTRLDQGAANIGSSGSTRTGSWVVLRDELTLNQYFISNSHWQHDSATERAVNAQKVADQINSNNTGNLPEIVFGDFNAVPGTTELNLLKSELDVVDALMEDENTFHDFHGNGSKKLDYIMSSKNMAILSYDVIRTSYSGAYPSDHFPVMAKFVPGIHKSAVNDGTGSGSSNTKFSFADINGDGKKDKILWRYNLDSGKPRVYLSNGDGTFSSSYVSHTAGASGVATTNYYYADVNGDGKDDQIVWNPSYTSGNTRVYLATTGGSFSATAIQQAASASLTTRLYFADINGDGMADRIFWNPNYDSGNNRVYFATGGGNFNTTPVTTTVASSESDNSTYYYADINGDGKADKILWHPTVNSGKTMVYLSNGDGQFTASASYSTAGPSSTATTKYYFTDLNGDGRADKIFWRPDVYKGKLKIYFSDSDGTFDGPLFSLRGASSDATTQFFFADISGDGKADQLFWNNSEYSGDFKNYLAK
jgi:endonuclease/exonuclease/phosphatase family metal-dependent hydrolase